MNLEEQREFDKLGREIDEQIDRDSYADSLKRYPLRISTQPGVTAMSVLFSPDFDDYASGRKPASACRCVLCGHVATSCCCPPFGHPAYFVLTDFRHGRVTADSPEFRKWFRLASDEATLKEEPTHEP